MAQKDCFGFETQGKQYDIYRPSYPPQFLDSLLQRTKNKSHYLDVAIGTGKIFFEIFQNFEHSKGIDISKKMISVCNEKAREQGISNAEFKCQDFLKANIDEKFDLITIGQALHWVPVRQCLQKSKGCLTPSGRLAVFGYFLSKIEGQIPEQTEKINKLYEQFYEEKVKKNQNSDRDQLHAHYSDPNKYPFEQIFSKVHREVVSVPTTMNKSGFIAYLKTFSGYNSYLQKFSHLEDPIMPIARQMPQNIELNLKFDYFCIVCQP